MDTKLTYGVTSPCGDVHNLIARTMWRFSEEERAELTRRVGSPPIYFWYTEIPVLESRSARDYLRRYNVTTTPTHPPDFDWMSYAFYLMLHEGWTGVDLTAMTGQRCFSLGEEGGGNAEALRKSQPHWAIHQVFTNYGHMYADADIVMTFHHDRKW